MKYFKSKEWVWLMSPDKNIICGHVCRRTVQRHYRWCKYSRRIFLRNVRTSNESCRWGKHNPERRSGLHSRWPALSGQSLARNWTAPSALLENDLISTQRQHLVSNFSTIHPARQPKFMVSCALSNISMSFRWLIQPGKQVDTGGPDCQGIFELFSVVVSSLLAVCFSFHNII